jgi:tetratricopeptide (TPR) repeat protein
VTTEPRRSPWPAALAALALVALAWVIYGQTLAHAFVNFDDPDYVTANPAVLAGLSADSVRWAFTAFHSGHWHPLTWLSHMLDIQLFGLDAGRHHLSQLLLWSLASVLLFALLHTWLRDRWRPFLVALLFVAHPLRVESVAWVTTRKDLLSLLFGLLTLLAWTRWARDRRPWAYAAALLTFACALMSKPLVMTLPAVLLLLDVWPLERLALTRAELWTRARPLVLEKLPFFALSATSLAVTFLSQRAGGAVVAADSWGLSDRVFHSTSSVFVYLGMLLWPADLAVFYPLRSPNTGVGVVALVAGIAITAQLARHAHAAPARFVAWVWFGVCLAPIIGLVQVGGQSVADRYTLWPSIGLLLGVVCAAPAWLQNKRGVALALVVAGALVVVSFIQVRHWRDSFTLWDRALAVTDDNFMAHLNVGAAHEVAGRLRVAEEHYEEAFRLRPGYPPIALNRANSFARAGKLEEAAPLYRYVIERRPNDANARYNFGLALAHRGHADEAIQRIEEALALNPNHASAHLTLGDLHRRRGDVATARRHLERAARLNPNDPTARKLLSTLPLE